MDRECIERLASERALGTMSADVQQLLDAYLHQDAEAKTVVQQTARTVELARKAMSEHPVKSLPAFPVAGFTEIERWQRRLRMARQLTAVAACLVIGLAVGRWTAPVKTLPAIDTRIDQVMVANAPRLAPVQENAGYWSIERLRSQYERTDRPSVSKASSLESLRQRLPRSG